LQRFISEENEMPETGKRRKKLKIFFARLYGGWLPKKTAVHTEDRPAFFAFFDLKSGNSGIPTVPKN
jgi:hypothetical protein